jgi:cytochrome c oxidase assembly factor CtaG
VGVTDPWTPLGAAADYAWTFDPGPLLLIGLLAWLYVPRWVRVRRDHGAKAAPVWRLLSYLTGLASLAVALVSPVDGLAEQALTMHMFQHVILLDVVPICLILGLTKIILRPATRRLQALERALGPLMHPAVAVVLYIAVMWVWHVPALYDAALENETVHVLEHVMFLSVGLLYWWQLLSPIRSRFHGGVMGPIAYMLATKLGVGVLGIGLTFAPDSIYPYYQDREPIWGLTVDGDQQLAGELMTLEQMLIMGVALAYLLFRALEQSEREQARRDRLEDLREGREPEPAG